MYAEILAGPIKIYRAVVGTPEPLPPSDSPPAAWTLVSDNTQYTKDGLNVAMTDERDEIEVMNKLYPIKEYRTSARKKFEVKLKDMKIETLALLLGNAMSADRPDCNHEGLPPRIERNELPRSQSTRCSSSAIPPMTTKKASTASTTGPRASPSKAQANSITSYQCQAN